MFIDLGDEPLSALVEAQSAGHPIGIYSVCSANWTVLEASLRHAMSGSWPLLIESTCNQVNQFGGYTGMTPEMFIGRLRELAQEVGFPTERLLMGGDHLGPNPWRNEPAGAAMAKARTLVQACVRAGYEKIHLDASMPLGDDDPGQPLATEIAAARAADLAAASEAAYRARGEGRPPCYVIGTEVPVPGGARDDEELLSVSDPEGVAETIAVTQEAFAERGLADAWGRVIAVVVQPGVEFSDQSLFVYERAAARPLSAFIEEQPIPLVYEAHSTDYQPASALRQLVEDHFAILKVGPALTFAYREAMFALEMMEQELAAAGLLDSPSGLRDTLERAMVAEPGHWAGYYDGSPGGQRLKRHFSFSDRVRYYWPVPEVADAARRLLENLEKTPPPLALLSQFLPRQYARVRGGELANEPLALLMACVGDVLDDYAYACGYVNRADLR